MPRRPRRYTAGTPCHVIQRGNNRAPCFFAQGDYDTYLKRLAEALSRHGVLLHAYVLMTNHVHLLLTPSDAVGISRVMQSVGRRYVQYVNWKYSRTGTLWEGRHRSSLVTAQDYLLRCYCYIETNPVRAGMVVDPGQYAWSSFACNASGQRDQLVTPHDCYLELGPDPATRQCRYKNLVRLLTPEDIQVIRHAGRRSAPIVPGELGSG